MSLDELCGGEIWLVERADFCFRNLTTALMAAEHWGRSRALECFQIC